VGRGRTPVITVLVPPGLRQVGERIELDEDEAHHLRVRRGEQGAQVQFRDGQGGGGTGLLTVEGRAHLLTVEMVQRVPSPAPLVLAVGAGDRERFAWLVEKASELGVSEVVPLETARTVNVATRVRDTHLEKLARRAREAVKQSGAHWAPRVLPVVAFERFVADARPGVLWVLDAAGGAPATLRPDEAMTALIGPEGGFTERELAQAIGAGYTPVRVGAHTLRFETAAIAAAVLAQVGRERRTDG